MNIPLLAIVVTVGIVACVGVYFLNKYQVKHLSVVFLESARASVEDLAKTEDPLDRVDKIKEIGRKYSRYLANNPNDLEVQSECAMFYADQGKALLEASPDVTDYDKQRSLKRFAIFFHSKAIGFLENVLRIETEMTEERAKLVSLFYDRVNWGRTIDLENALVHLRFLVSCPTDAKALAQLFNRYDLWKRVSPPISRDQPPQMSLAQFLSSDTKVVDREKLLKFLGDDLWMILDDSKLLGIYGHCQANHEKYNVAERSYKKAISLAPDNPELYVQLARILRKIRPPRSADADYWMNEMVIANPDSYSPKLKRARYWNVVAMQDEKGEDGILLAKNAVRDALGGMQKAITVIADEADAQAVSLPETKQLKAALEKLPKQPPNTNKQITPEYQDALLDANKSAVSLKDKLEGISDEIEACREGLLLAAMSEWVHCYLKKDRSKKDLKDARRYVMSLTNLFPNFPNGYMVLYEIDQQSGDMESAIANLRRGSEACSGNTDLLWRLGTLLIDGKMIDEARLVCKKIEATNSDQCAVDHLKASLAFSEERWQAAAAVFESVRDEVARRWATGARQMDFQLAECYGRLGDFDKQRDAYFRAASSDLTRMPALVGIAQTKARSGQLDEAIEDYRMIVKLPNAPKTISFKLARLLLTRTLSKPKAERDYSEIMSLISTLERSKSNPLQIAFLKADVHFSQGDYAKSINVLGRILKKLEAAQSDIIKQLDTEKQRVDSLSGDAKESAQAEANKLDYILRKNKAEQASIWLALVKVAKRKNDWAAVGKAFNEAKTLVGDTPDLRLMHGEIILARLGEKAAEPLRNLAGNTKNYSKAARLRLWRGLCKLSLRAGDQQQVRILSKAVLRDEPGSREMQVVNFELAVQNKDTEAINKILSEIKGGGENPGAFWYYGQTVLLNMIAKDGDTKQLNQARSHLEKALKIRPNWSAAWVLDATLHDRQGNIEAAVKSYRKAIDLGSQSTQLIRRAVQLLAKLDRFREADEILRLLGERQDSVTGNADYETSVIKAQIGKYEDALVYARKVAADSNKPSDFVWLGQLLSIVGRQAENQGRDEDAQRDLKEAEKAFAKAVELDPKDDNAWVAKIQFYGQTGQTQKAEAAIASAKANLSAEKAAAAIAHCYEAIGKTKDAEKQLLANVAKSRKDTAEVEQLADFYIRNKQDGKAVEQLKNIIDNERATLEQKSKARRSYATILYGLGGESNRRKALKLIERNLLLNASSQVDQYAKAVLLASDLSPTQRKKAIPALEKLLAAQHTPSAEIQFTLAKLYFSEGQMQDFKGLMRVLLGGKEQDPRYLSFYTEALIEKNELQEAGIYLDMLKQAMPDDFLTHKLISQNAFKQKYYETAIKVLVNSSNKPNDDKKQQTQDIINAANVLADFASILKKNGRDSVARGFDDKAEEVYKKYVDMQPGRELLMAQFLSRLGHFARGLKLLEQHAPQSSADNIAKACFSFLQGTVPNVNQLHQINDILQDALKKYPKGQDAVILKTALAVLRDYQGRADETESIYREILKEKPNDPTAMNNLAVFLALHRRNLDEALNMIDKAIINYGKIPGLLDTRALVHIAQNQPKKALDDLSLVLVTQPTPVRYFHQAQAYIQDGQKDAAINAMEKARKLGFKEDRLAGVERQNYRRLQMDLQ